MRALGHRVRIAVADGPELARAFARWGAPAAKGKAVRVVSSERTRDEVRALPVVALPLSDECRGLLVRLGVLTLGDLAALPRSVVGGRLEGEVSRALDLALWHRSHAARPVPTRGRARGKRELRARRLRQRAVARSLCGGSRRGSPPGFRGAVKRPSRSCSPSCTIVRSRSCAASNPKPSSDFPSPPRFTAKKTCAASSSHGSSVCVLPAPSVGLVLSAPVLVSAVQRQLELGEALARNTGAADELPLVLAELRSDLGEERVGVLRTLDAHRLEAQSMLEPTDGSGERPQRRGRSGRSERPPEGFAPTLRKRRWPCMFRALRPGSSRAGSPGARRSRACCPKPLPLEAALRVGATVAVDHRLYSIERLRFEQRLFAVEWWTRAPVQRDYVGSGFAATAASSKRSHSSIARARSAISKPSPTDAAPDGLAGWPRAQLAISPWPPCAPPSFSSTSTAPSSRPAGSAGAPSSALSASFTANPRPARAFASTA